MAEPGGKCRTGDAPHFISFVQQLRAGDGPLDCEKTQFRKPAVYVAARANPLDDFLSRVASLFVVDVRVFQSGLVRNLLIIVVVAKPGNPTLEPNGVDGFHSGGRAPMKAHALRKVVP